mmetsp:Transcript_23636/g.55098  ORF Transcript_23636/g.55098 Transcript_23636/m.55098 type:complete len:209 (-) Transcript_23636:719-1345(-)
MTSAALARTGKAESLSRSVVTWPDGSSCAMLTSIRIASNAVSRTSQSSISRASAAADMALSSFIPARASKAAHLGFRISGGGRMEPPATTLDIAELSSPSSPSSSSTALAADAPLGPSAPRAKAKAHLCDAELDGADESAAASWSAATGTPLPMASTAARLIATLESPRAAISPSLAEAGASSPKAAKPWRAPSFAPGELSFEAIALP